MNNNFRKKKCFNMYKETKDIGFVLLAEKLIDADHFDFYVYYGAFLYMAEMPDFRSFAYFRTFVDV